MDLSQHTTAWGRPRRLRRKLSVWVAATLAWAALLSHGQAAPAAVAAPAVAVSAVAAASADQAQAQPRYAIVVQDNTVLRSAARDSALQQAVLWQGELLEVRGERFDYVQVYDHRRERPGYVRANQLRPIQLSAQHAPELLAVLRFVRDLPGAETLGLGYAAAYLKAVPGAQLDPFALDALGTLAERLARRASARQGDGRGRVDDPKLAGHLDVAASLGLKLSPFERDGNVVFCDDGDAYRRVLAWPMSGVGTANKVADPVTLASYKARAALGLSRADCQDPAMPPSQRLVAEQARLAVLDQAAAAVAAAALAQPASAASMQVWQQRLRVRQAAVLASCAHARAQLAVLPSAAIANRGQAGSASATTPAAASLPIAATPAAAIDDASRALQTLALVPRAELSDDDQLDYHDAALRVAASRWLAVAPSAGDGTSQRLVGPWHLRAVAGDPGQTCVQLSVASKPGTLLMQRCTYGVVSLASAQAQALTKPQSQQSSQAKPGADSLPAVALSVQTLPGWRELWVFRASAQGWVVDVIPPQVGNSQAPDLGYAEFAGWVPGGERMLVVREARVDGRYKRSFEVYKLDDGGWLAEKQASNPDLLVLFGKWQDPVWKRMTLSLR